MPYDDILCSWLLRSALVSLAILLIGSGAVLVWRQPLRRVRIIELVLAGCLIAPLLGMIPGYPQLSLAWWHSTAVKQQASPLPHPEPMTEPMPFPSLDHGTQPVSDTKTVEAPVGAFEIRPWIVGFYLAGVTIGAGWWLVGIVGLAAHFVVIPACIVTLPGIAYRDFRRACWSGSTFGEPPPQPAVCLCLGASGDCPAGKPLRR